MCMGTTAENLQNTRCATVTHTSKVHTHKNPHTNKPALKQLWLAPILCYTQKLPNERALKRAPDTNHGRDWQLQALFPKTQKSNPPRLADSGPCSPI